MITDSAGVIKAESDYYPWGGELQFVANDSNHYKFTGKERDTETNLDYFGARYYSNGLGRFITPDWAAKAAAVPYAEFSDPQSLNLYTYVRNIPTVKVDPDGHCCEVEEEVATLVAEHPQVATTVAETAEAVGDTAVATATVSLRFVVGVVGVVLFGSQKAGDPSQTRKMKEILDNDKKQSDKPVEPAAASGGSQKGGGRNAQKSNPDKQKSAKDKLDDLKQQRDALKSKPNKTPEDKAQLEKVNKAINRETDRLKKSETHSRKDKGQQQ